MLNFIRTGDQARAGLDLSGRLRRLAGSREGVAMIDLALVMPVLVFLLLGGLELGRFMLLNEKLSRLANSVGDLVSQADGLTQEELDQVFIAAGYTARPFEIGDAGAVVVSSVSTDDSTPVTPTVNWQQKGAGTANVTSQVGTEGQPANLPSGFSMDEQQNVIIAEVFFDYTPFFFDKLIGQKQLYYSAVYRPRIDPLLEIESAGS